MKELGGRAALLTGAAGGLGRHIARALAAEHVNLALSGRNEDALVALRDELRARGVVAEVVPADLSDLSQIHALVERAEAAVGPLDALVNNAGIELTAAFTNLTREELERLVTVNLTAPLVLTHRVVPDMLARGRGHVVNVSSLAGKSGPAYGEPYAATKAGLVGLTQSLRAEFADAPVGFSVVCPGFVSDDGMYARMESQGVKAPASLGATTPEKVARAVVRCIVDDVPEALVTPRPIRPMLAIAALAPRVAELVVRRTGANEFFRRAAQHQGRL